MKVWPPKKVRCSSNFLFYFCEAHGQRSEKSLLQVTNMPPAETQEFPFQARDNYQPEHTSPRLIKGAWVVYQQTYLIETTIQGSSSAACGWHGTWAIGTINSSRMTLQSFIPLLAAGAVITSVFTPLGQCQELHSPHLLKSALLLHL